MKTLKLHSKTFELLGQIVSEMETKTLLEQLRKILDLRHSNQISVAEAGKRIRQAAWRISEDLQLNDLALSSGRDNSLMDGLPSMLRA